LPTQPIKEQNHIKKLCTFVFAAIIALSFSVVGFAQDKAADTKDQPAAAEKMEKMAPVKKAKKSTKKEQAAPAASSQHLQRPALDETHRRDFCIL
jgi:hypothetical protein